MSTPMDAVSGAAAAQAPGARASASELTRFALGVAGLALAVNALARGLVDSFSAFVLPLTGEFGWSRADITLGYAIYMLSYGLTAPLCGMLFDRLGARTVWALGSGVLGASFLGASQMHSLWQFHLLVGLGSGFGVASMGMVTASALVARWFRRELSAVMSVVYAGMGLGVLAIVPGVQWIVQTWGWRSAYATLGWAMLALLPLLLFVLPMRRISGGNPQFAAARAARTTAGGGHAAGTDVTLLQALRSRTFWGLFAVFFFTTGSIYAVAPQAIAFLVEQGVAPMMAASAFGATGVLSVVGMLSLSWLSRRIGERAAATLSYIGTMAGIGCLMAVAFWPGAGLVIAFVVLFGGNQGARGPMVATLAARLFGGAGLSAIYGAITTGLGFGGAVASYASGWLHDLTGGYQASFGMAIVLAACGMLPFWLLPEFKAAAREPLSE